MIKRNLYLEKDKDFLKWVSQYTKVRITHVATEYSSDKKIEEYINFSNEINSQFTVKELSGFDDKGRYKEICNKFKDKVYCLDDDDYNIYFMPDNSIRKNFI